MEPYEQKVKRLADTWSLNATMIENELCESFDTSEPTRLMYAVHHEMTKTNPLKAAQFEKHFLAIFARKPSGDGTMTRNPNEIAADAATLKESGYWRFRSGHTAAEETDKYEAAKARLKNDLKHDPEAVMAVAAGDDDAFERRVDELVESTA